MTYPPMRDGWQPISSPILLIWAEPERVSGKLCAGLAGTLGIVQTMRREEKSRSPAPGCEWRRTLWG